MIFTHVLNRDISGVGRNEYLMDDRSEPLL
jgi:hypothetical protein